MKKDEVKVSSGLGFDDLCKFIEKCVSKKYQVDKTESFRVSTLSLYTGSFKITVRKYTVYYSKFQGSGYTC